MSLLDRLYEKINIDYQTDCYLWEGETTEEGFGKIEIDGKYVEVHTLCWKIIYYDIPKHYYVEHKCLNKLCINHLHLKLNKKKEKFESKKTNTLKGSKKPNSKLVEDDVIEIKKLLRDKVSVKKVSEMYNISKQTVSHIKNGRSWKHVKEK